ncbi:MAG: HDOD domain-containing protein [bacterium]
MKKILFVDDELRVVQALGRMLRSMRNEWDIKFALSGQEALKILANNPVDVVVSDIRMPGMDGAQLLKQIRRRYPQIVRIFLSGQSDHEALIKSADVAHQFLTKPFEAHNLKTIITRVFALRELLNNEKLSQLISGIRSLPTLPKAYLDIKNELYSDEASISRVVDIIEKDIGMTTKILQMINSSYFGLPSQIKTVKHAVVLLGLETLKTFMLTNHIFSHFSCLSLKQLHVDKVITHSIYTGNLAAYIAKLQNQDSDAIGEARLAGFLHDCGKLLLADKLKKEYGQIIERAISRNLPLWYIERETLGTTHGEVGAYLLGIWGLPDNIIEILAFHHHPSDCLQKGLSSLAAVEAANLFLHEKEQIQSDTLTCEETNAYFEKIGLSDQLLLWRKMCTTLNEHALGVAAEAV